MRLNVEILEDLRGGRSVRSAVHLQGPNAAPENPGDAGASAKLVDQDSRLPGAAVRVLAAIELVAADDLDEDRLWSDFEQLRDELSAANGGWVRREHVAASFLLADRLAGERDAILGELLRAARVRMSLRGRWTPLRVLSVHLDRFRVFENLTLQLSERQSTVLVGVNGSGKTTLLDAMVLLLARFEAGVRVASERPRELGEDDIMNGSASTTISVAAQIGASQVTWSLLRARLATEQFSLSSLDEHVASIHAELASGVVSLPVAVHYPVNRAVLDIPLRIRTTHPFEPLETYDGALAAGSSNFRLFFEWFRDREDLENETRIQNSDHRDHQLEAVRRAIASLVPGLSDLRVQRAPLRMLVTKGEWTLYVDQLSDGEKCLLAMAGDLARRLAMGNPFADDPLRGGGAVLIDEIELHLHPGWQRRIVPALERTFPNCQFIVTTHSPAVLGHVGHDSVFILRPESTGIAVSRPTVSEGMDVNRILEDLLEVSARPAEFEEKLRAMHQKMDAGDTAAARALHTALATTLGADDPALVRADVLLRRREAASR